ncbi:hypothetical protein B0H14DRAFT_3016101 [Mycena olivaceomarginata]|nr:hypothetical protein B0H14DRAFT_3016101 [Mycena olivaceomarginata]
MESYTIDRTAFDASWAQVTPILYETAIELVFYMIFVAMFAVSTYLYYPHKVTDAHFLLYSTSAMFILGTIQITLKMVIAVFALRIVRLAVEGSSLVRSMFIHDRIVFVRSILLITNSQLFTDATWSGGQTISVTFLPIAMLTATTIMGYVTAFRDNYQFKSTISRKSLLSSGRMWWIGREVARASSLPGTRSYNAAGRHDSGALYSFCVIAYLVSRAFLSPPAVRPDLKHAIAFDHIHDSVRQTIINNVLTGALPQVVDFPVLITIRVGFHRGLEARFRDRASGSANMTFTSVRMRSFA